MKPRRDPHDHGHDHDSPVDDEVEDDPAPRRRRSDTDLFDSPLSLSQWAQTVLKMTSATAVIVIACFLVWRMAGSLDKIDALTLQHTEMAAQFRANDIMMRRMLVVMRVMCVNGARDENARQNCLQEDLR